MKCLYNLRDHLGFSALVSPGGREATSGSQASVCIT